MGFSPPVPAADRRPAPLALHLPPAAAAVFVPYLPPAAAAVLALGPRDCRWPLGEPAGEGFRFCAAPRRPRSSYCPLHARAAGRRTRGGAA